MPRRRRHAGVHDDCRAARDDALEPGMGRVFGRVPGRAGLVQRQVDLPVMLFETAVEHGEPAIAQLHAAQHRRHPVDRALHHRGGVLMARGQYAAHIDQVAQDVVLQGRAAFGGATVGMDPVFDLMFQQRQALVEPGLCARQAGADIDQPLGGPHPSGAAGGFAGHICQVPGLPCDALENAVAEIVLGAAAEIVVLAQPVDEPFRGNVRAPGVVVEPAEPVDPVADHVAAQAPAGLAAGRAKIAEPGEAVGLDRQFLAAPQFFALEAEGAAHDRLADLGIAGPGVVRHQQNLGRAGAAQPPLVDCAAIPGARETHTQAFDTARYRQRIPLCHESSPEFSHRATGGYSPRIGPGRLRKWPCRQPVHWRRRRRPKAPYRR